MSFYLGMDAGGTRTEAALAESETILARASGGSIKLLRTSPSEAARRLEELLGELAKRTGVSLQNLRASCVGIAGSSIGFVSRWVAENLGRLAGGEIEICGDTEIALDAAFPGGAGVLVIAGTGSNILGRAPDGRTVTVGGWGPVLGDEGSGHWIGLAALRALLRAHDREERSALLDAILARWQATEAERILDIVYGASPPDFAALAPLVAEAADRGDSLARSVLHQAGVDLGGGAALALKKLQRLDPSTPQRVAFTGSVLARIGPVWEAFAAELHRQAPEAAILEEAVDPVRGALWRARRRGGAAERHRRPE